VCALGKERIVLAIEYILMGIVSLLVGIYLVVALLRPDRF
jgi:K+-transporting ATPase KdpF subunit